MFVNVTANGAVTKVTKTGWVPQVPGLYIRFDPEQIVFRFGRSNAPYTRCPQYSADACNDDGSLAKKPDGSTAHYDLIPKAQPPKTGQPQQYYGAHYHYGQWMHYIVPDAVVCDPNKLMSLNLVPPMAIIGGKLGTVPTNSYNLSDPMDNAGLTFYQGTTGERPEIGEWHEAFGHFMRTGDIKPLMAVARGGFTQPIFVMDVTTEKPIDKIARPYSTLTGASWTNDLLTNYPGASWSPDPDSAWSPDTGHQPEAFFGLFLVTRQPRYAEACQYQSIINMLGSTFFLNEGKNWSPPLTYAIPPFAQIRDIAWALRSAVFAAKATEMVEQDCTARGIPFPSYMLSFAQVKATLDNIRKFLTDYYVNSGLLDEFRIPCSPTFPDLGFVDYLNQSVMMCARYYPSDWSAIAKWMLPNITRRTSGKTGYPPANPTAYRVQLTKTGPSGKPWPEGDPPLPYTAADGSKMSGLKATDFFTWGEAWGNIVSAAAALPAGGTIWNLPKSDVDALVKDPYNGMQFAAWIPYACFEANAVLAMAVDLQRKGIVDFADPDLENCYATTRQMTLNYVAAGPKNAIDARVSFDTTAQPPVVVVPPPVNPPPPPPTTGDPMSTFIQGTKYSLPLKPDGTIYGVDYSSKPDGQITVTPTATGVDFVPVVDTTVEDFVINAFVHTDPVDKTKGFTKTFSGTDAFKAATAEGTTFGPAVGGA